MRHVFTILQPRHTATCFSRTELHLVNKIQRKRERRRRKRQRRRKLNDQLSYQCRQETQVIIRISWKKSVCLSLIQMKESAAVFTSVMLQPLNIVPGKIHQNGCQNIFWQSTDWFLDWSFQLFMSRLLLSVWMCFRWWMQRAASCFWAAAWRRTAGSSKPRSPAPTSSSAAQRNLCRTGRSTPAVWVYGLYVVQVRSPDAVSLTLWLCLRRWTTANLRMSSTPSTRTRCFPTGRLPTRRLRVTAASLRILWWRVPSPWWQPWPRRPPRRPSTRWFMTSVAWAVWRPNQDKRTWSP